MVSLSADRPTEVVLAARVARQFYLEGISKVEIADPLQAHVEIMTKLSDTDMHNLTAYLATLK